MASPAAPPAHLVHDGSTRPVIVGAGLAGLAAALAAAPTPVIVVSKAAVGEETSSAWAQGGLAAAIGDDDAPTLHASDTHAAGAGLCIDSVVDAIIGAGPEVVTYLAALGASFDRDGAGRIRLGLEAAHSRHRIVHAQGDGSGREIMRAIVASVKATPSITLLENAAARDLLVGIAGIAGVVVEQHGRRFVLATDKVILATGGVGGLWLHTTNPRGSLGQGLVLAARAGAALADLEFVQFHPTAIDAGVDPMPLASEALRGEGAVLVDDFGVRFMAAHGKAELEPRDVVARAIWERLRSGRRVFLDCRQAIGASFATRFPAIHALCTETGIDPAREPIPVRPAAHYHMGGVLVDGHGRTSVPGLWACGECASTGLHGANRLASNSLLEAIVTGRRAATDAIATPPRSPGAAPLPEGRTGETPADRQRTREVMSADVGVLRDATGLRRAVAALQPLAGRSDTAFAGLMIAVAALMREESRGGHFRSDFPSPAPAWHRRLVFDATQMDAFLRLAPSSRTIAASFPVSKGSAP